MTIVLVINALLLCASAWQDIKEKQFLIAFPLLMFAINLVGRFYTTKVFFTGTELLIVAIVILVVAISKQKVGMGDALIMIGLMPLCGMYGCGRIFVDALLCMGLWRFIKANIIKAKIGDIEAFVPYISLGYLLWVFI